MKVDVSDELTNSPTVQTHIRASKYVDQLFHIQVLMPPGRRDGSTRSSWLLAFMPGVRAVLQVW